MTYQTVRLTAGADRSAVDGVCVMELASMLSGDRFTDKPRAVCPVLRSFMHGYNDQLPDAMRQDLYGVASELVGTHDNVDVTAWRRHACMRWADALHAPGRLAQFRGLFCRRSLRDCELAGRLAGRLAGTDPSQHGQTFVFLRALIAHHGKRGKTPGRCYEFAPPAATVIPIAHNTPV